MTPGLEFLELLSAPALVLALAAQFVCRASLAAGREVVMGVSGFAAARAILDAAGLEQVAIEQAPGSMGDGFEAARGLLRLGTETYHGRSLAAVVTASHEAAHALQAASRPWSLAIRSLAVPAAGYGGTIGLVFMLIGLASSWIFLLGTALFTVTVLLQLASLPTEFAASRIARGKLLELGLVVEDHLPALDRGLNAASLFPLAATVQPIVAVLGNVFRYIARQ